MSSYRITFEMRTAWERDKGQRPEKIVEAKYPQFTDGWVIFKDDDNKIVYQVKESAVEAIEKVTPTVTPYPDVVVGTDLAAAEVARIIANQHR